MQYLFVFAIHKCAPTSQGSHIPIPSVPPKRWPLVQRTRTEDVRNEPVNPCAISNIVYNIDTKPRKLNLFENHIVGAYEYDISIQSHRVTRECMTKEIRGHVRRTIFISHVCSVRKVIAHATRIINRAIGSVGGTRCFARHGLNLTTWSEVNSVGWTSAHRIVQLTTTIYELENNNTLRSKNKCQPLFTTKFFYRPRFSNCAYVCITFLTAIIATSHGPKRNATNAKEITNIEHLNRFLNYCNCTSIDKQSCA